jgi:hypothetical protein
MSPRSRKKLIKLPKHEATPLPIVADAAIGAVSVADGRLIPVLIVDTSERPDIDQLVRAHQYIAPGDVDTTWMRNRDKVRLDSVSLLCEFKRPVKCVVILEFPLPEKVAVVDLIVGSEAMYLQPGKPGDRIAATLDNPKIIADVSSLDFRPTWDRILTKVVENQFRSRGLRGKQAREAARELIQRDRELWTVRVGDFA